MTLAVQLRLPSISIAGRQQLKRIDYTLRFPQCELGLGMPHRQPTETNRGDLDSSPPRPISKKAKAALARVPLATVWPYAVWACRGPAVLGCAQGGVRAARVAAERNRCLRAVGDWSLVLYHKQFRERCGTNL